MGEESRSKKSASFNKIFGQLNFFQQLKWQLWTLLYEALAARSGDIAQVFLEAANMAGAQYYCWARDRLKTRRTKQSIASFVIMIKSKEKTFCSKQCTGNFSGKRQQDVNNIGSSQRLTCTTKGWFCGGWFQLIKLVFQGLYNLDKQIDACFLCYGVSFRLESLTGELSPSRWSRVCLYILSSPGRDLKS